MNIEFCKKKSVEAVIEESILLNGKNVGKICISTTEPQFYRYMAVLEVEDSFYLYGYGHTREEAVASAIERGKKEVHAMLQCIGEYESLLAI